MTNKKIISYSKDVTSIYFLIKDLELFKFLDEEIVLSRGLMEKSNPLPVVNALSKSFFKYFNDESQSVNFIPSNNPDQGIIFKVFQDVQDSLELSNMSFSPLRLDLNDVYNPLTIELLAIIYSGATYASGNRRLNKRFKSLLLSLGLSPKEVGWIHDKRLEEQVFFRAKITEWEFYSDRSKNKFKGELEDALKEELGIQRTIATNPKNIFGLAWSELYFADMYKIPASICTFCGRAYRLVGKGNKGSFRKNNCGKENCQKIARSQRDQLKRQQDEEDVRQNDKIRKRNSRKNKAINMIKQKKTNEVIAKETGASIADIQEWREQYKKRRL
jgi:hypothetical protein